MGILKVKITSCENKKAWYANSIGLEVDCRYITSNGYAIVPAKIVNEIDKMSVCDADGYISKDEFVVVQCDNRI